MTAGDLLDTAEVRALLPLRTIEGRLDAGAVRAAHYGSPHEPVTAEEMVVKLAERSFRWAGLRCYLCGAHVRAGDLPTTWHLDHLVPLAVGGAHSLSNLELACAVCNLAKGSLDLSTLLGVPPWDKVRPLWDVPSLWARPVEDLWLLDHHICRKLARRPRDVVISGAMAAEAERLLVGALLRQDDIYRTVDVTTLRDRLGLSRARGTIDTWWCEYFGMPYKQSTVKWYPSRFVLPTQIGGGGPLPRARGFRLRFRVRGGDAAAFVRGEIVQPGVVGAFDQDEVPYIAPAPRAPDGSFDSN
jgi:hypothetical protein